MAAVMETKIRAVDFIPRVTLSDYTTCSTVFRTLGYIGSNIAR
jgi:hypothetical protein